MRKIFYYFFYSYLLIKIDCYCEGNHNRNDLDKKQCARYEIEKEEVDGDNVENYECCYVYSLMTDLVEKECLVYTKNLGEKLLGEAFINSPLNIFNAEIECSFIYLSFNIIYAILLIFLVII